MGEDMEEIAREVGRQLGIIGTMAAETVPHEELRANLTAALKERRPMRVKYGIDPTTANIHIGHLVPCRLLRLFQDLDHIAVLIIGDYTATVGDPTDRSSERKRLSPREVANNMRLYSEELYRAVDRRKAAVHHQSE